ncbi:MAG TPA: hypothetical protein VM120_09650 [Bryobacteraceae bacterium]|nr:hypothetical protein [Bryobacteraceae bacterium]
MKRKPKDEQLLISKEIMEQAKRAIHLDHPRPAVKCKICAGDAAPTSTEGLCWVCRRLKISAWRDSDQQISAQE